MEMPVLLGETVFVPIGWAVTTSSLHCRAWKEHGQAALFGGDKARGPRTRTEITEASGRQPGAGG